MARKTFSEEDCIKVLLWCGRHCCLCEKFAGVGIEVAHLPGRASSSEIEDGVPLCFDCHAAIGHYNKNHPRGRSYRGAELKARREQVYDRHTSHLVPPVKYLIRQELPQGGQRRLPDVGFTIHNRGDRHPVQARVSIILAQGSSRYSIASGHYNGSHLWNLNPGQMFNGHFAISAEVLQSSLPLRARVDVTLIDIYKRPHRLLPVGFINGLRPIEEWYAEPSMEELGIELDSHPPSQTQPYLPPISKSL